MPNLDRIHKNKLIMDSFLDLQKIIEDQYKVKYGDNLFGYIYCIEHKNTGKKYIGSTYSLWEGSNSNFSILSKRASHYIYEYNKMIDRNSTTLKSTSLRPITKAMIEEGIENFIMYPIAETIKSNHFNAEKYFIDKFDTIENGYNIRKIDQKYFRNGQGRKHNLQDKLLRSEEILAIHINNKEIVISDSMKLFSDHIFTTKDMIKNTTRKGRVYKGWYIFYTNPLKSQDILERVVLGDALPEQERHSIKSKKFYTELHEDILLYLKKFPSSELFPNFKYSELRYKE